MERRDLAKVMLQTSGCALMLLGALHFLATPEIPHLFDGMSREARHSVLGPTMLNHLVVGVLLFPLGFTTWIAAKAWYLGETWTRPVLITNCLAAFVFPPTLMMFMEEPEYAKAPLFLTTAALTAIAAAGIPVAALVGGGWSRKPA